MALPIQAQNRQEIREEIGRNLRVYRQVTAESTVDTSSLISTIGFPVGGDNEFNGRQVVMLTPTGSIVAGEISWITGFATATKDATCAPVFSANITDGDIFEVWHLLTQEDVNSAINQAIMSVTAGTLQDKVINDVYTGQEEYEYSWLSGFVALHTVEYCYSVAEGVQLSSCDVVWSELVDGDVTASKDTSIYKENNASLKLVCAAGLAAGDIAATTAITSTDLTLKDQAEIWIRSSVALDAGDWQLLLDNTASCASPVESLNIPATAANTWTRHLIALANPASDSAIISVGLKMVVDKGAHTLWADDIFAAKSASRVFKPLNPEQWGMVRGSTPKVRITPNGLSVCGYPTMMRLSGYQLPALLSDDTTDSVIDPGYLIAQATASLLLRHAKAPSLDVSDRKSLAKEWQDEADRRRVAMSTNIMPNTVSV